MRKSRSELPLVIGFPRSGNHWLNALMEAYFRQPRFNSYLYPFHNYFHDKISDIPMWEGDHDVYSDLTVKGKKTIIYLYRDPVDVIYSYYSSEMKRMKFKYGKEIKNFIDLYIGYLKKHYNKYFHMDIVPIKYERLKTNFISEFGKVIYEFDLEPDINRMFKVFNTLTKENMFNHIKKCHEAKSGKFENNPYFGEHMFTNQYAERRNNFKFKYGLYIKDKLISTEIKHLF
ncbi:MAG: sulfotransferase domain-containing protein [Bacteroidales bacterium]|nr:sulfotransferase domain-containing protein [Bacteroidales bacterium]